MVCVMAWHQTGNKALPETMMAIYWCIYVSLKPNELIKQSPAFANYVSKITGDW